MDQLDRVFGREEKGQSYSRYDNPTTNALEDLVTELEGGHGAVARASGMSAQHLALLAALLGIETTFVDVCDLTAVEAAVGEAKAGVLLMETVSNPLLRVGAMDKIAEITKRAGAPVVVDNTFATPLLVRPLELGASIVVHSATKYLAGHGDVLGGVIVAGESHFDTIKILSRTVGPTMSPFESYLTMRGIKTLALRVERQCANACKVASWLASHPKVDRVYFTGDPAHPDADTISRLFPKSLYGAMVAFELKGAGREGVFRFMERLQMIVRATSLGDVHTMMLYPAMSSHRDLAPKQRERLGIRDNLVRVSIGIEAAEDIIADLDQAMG